jgi:DNA transformation protein
VSGIDAEAIAELFAAFGPVDVRRMFGGAGIYSDGVFFALVDEGIIYLKADDKTAPRFAAEGCSQFVYQGKSREVAMSYWRMPERLYDDPDELADWARQAHAVAVRARMKKPRRKSAAAPSKAKNKRAAKRPARSGRAEIRDQSRK